MMTPLGIVMEVFEHFMPSLRLSPRHITSCQQLNNRKKAVGHFQVTVHNQWFERTSDHRILTSQYPPLSHRKRNYRTFVDDNNNTRHKSPIHSVVFSF